MPKNACSQLQVASALTPLLPTLLTKQLPSDVDVLKEPDQGEGLFGDGVCYFALLNGAKILLNANADSGEGLCIFAATINMHTTRKTDSFRLCVFVSGRSFLYSVQC